jgi:AraC-like DNA-binding protein
LADAPEWRLSDYICTSGPADQPFEEQHERVTIAAVIEGSFHYRANAGQAVLFPGAILLGNSGTCYECGHKHSHGDRCLPLQLAPEYFAELAASAAGSSRFTFPTAMLAATSTVLPWLSFIEARASSGEYWELEEAVPRFLETVIAAVGATRPAIVKPSARDERRIGDAVRWIELNADRMLDLNELAVIAIMSKYHFLRTFRRIVGMTPYQYLLSIRMRRAAVRLLRSAESISGIAFESGFGDLSTFNGRFRDVFGMSPSAFRRRR